MYRPYNLQQGLLISHDTAWNRSIQQCNVPAGLLTFLGRASHAYTVALDGTPVIYRLYGMVMTVSMLLIVSVQLVWTAVHGMLQ